MKYLNVNIINHLESNPEKVFWFVWGLTGFIKIMLSWQMPVTADEAYYAIWGLFPSLGGYDHTPMIGFFLYPFLKISHHPIVLRLPNVITTLLIGVIIHTYLKRFFLNAPADCMKAKSQASLAAILFLISPLSLCAVFITTDIPVILFCFLSGMCILKAVEKKDSLLLFGAGGLFLGLAFFSKYFAVLLALAYFVYLGLLSPSMKRYKGLLIIGLGVLPFGLLNLYWNYHHAWANILFNFYNRNEGEHGHWTFVVSYALIIVYTMTPVGLFYWLKYSKEWSRAGLLNALIAVPLLFFLGLSFYRPIGLHWPLAFITFVYVALGLYLNHQELKKSLTFLMVFTGAHALIIIAALCLPLSVIHTLPFSEKFYAKIVYFFRHADINKTLAQRYRFDLNHKHIVFSSFNYAKAALFFYDTGFYAPVLGVGDVHGREDDLLTDFKRHDRKDFIIFYDHPPRPSDYQAYFDQTVIKTLPLNNAVFYIVEAKRFNYVRYRDTVLKKVYLNYWQIPSYLPYKYNFFYEKYFRHAP